MNALPTIFICLAISASVGAAEIVVVYGKSKIVFCEIDPVTYNLDYPKFYMSKTEVTNQQYYDYLVATTQTKDDTEIVDIVEKRRKSGEYSTGDIPYSVDDKEVIWKNGKYPDKLDEHPVALVTLIEATKFANWLNSQSKEGLYRLPTWNEWMIAAYGSDRNFPWGDKPDVQLMVSSYGKTFNERLNRPNAVGSLPNNSSPEGILDLLGNVSEYLSEGDGQDEKYFNLGARWMGGDYGDGYAWGKDKDGKTGPKPRNDYWGYSHHAVMRQSSVGIRLVLDPSSNKALLSKGRVFKQNNKNWEQESE